MSRDAPPETATPSSRSRPAPAGSLRTAWRELLAAVAAVVLAAAWALAACGDDTPAQGHEGCWRATDVALADCTLLKVSKEDGAWLVRVDYGAPRPATLEDGTLLVAPGAPGAVSTDDGGETGSQVSLGLCLRHGRAVLLVREGSSSPAEVALESLTETAYEEQLTALSDDRVRMQIMELASAVHVWAEGHGGRPPAVPLLAPDSEFADSLAGIGTSWPTNPFTAEPAHAGDGPGDFAYTTEGRGFELAGYLSDGETYAAE